MQVFKRRTEEGAGLFKGLHAPFYKKVRKDAVNSKLRGEPGNLGRVSGFLQYPFTFLSHLFSGLIQSLQRYLKYFNFRN